MNHDWQSLAFVMFLSIGTELLAQSMPAEVWSAHEVSESLIAEIGNDFDPAEIAASRTFESLRQAESRPFWNQLLVAPEDPLANVCGLLLIEAESPESAFDASVRMVLKDTDVGAPVLGVAASIIAKAPSDRQQWEYDLLIARLGDSHDDEASIAVLLAMLPDSDIEETIQSRRFLHLPCDVVALVVDTIVGRKELAKKTHVKVRIQHIVKSLSTCSGNARVTYLQQVEPKPESFGQQLHAALIDDSIDHVTTLPLLLQFYDSHREVIQQAMQEMTANRHEFVANALRKLKRTE